MKLKQLLPLLLVSALVLMSVALYNGYPVTDSDSGAYISIGFQNLIARDRPPFYGWFIRYSSMWASLWYTIFVQCAVLAYLLFRYIRLLLGYVPTFNITLASILAIASFTCVSWVASYLMPDIFGGILLLTVLLFLMDTSRAPGTSVAYIVIIVASILVHNSHTVIMALFCPLLLIWSLIKRNWPFFRKSIILFTLPLFSWLLMCTINSTHGYGFVFSRSSHIFFMGRMAEMGLLKLYLDDNCVKKNYRLCNYKDEIPLRAWTFIWDNNGPFQKSGGWDSTKVEYDAITHDILSTPKYLGIFLQKSATGTLRTLTQVQAPEPVVPQGINTSPWGAITKFFADEQPEYLSSLQNRGYLSAAMYNYIYLFAFILSSIWVLLHTRLINKDVMGIYALLLVFLVVNALAMSAFSAVLNRYQNRIFWLLPATNIIIMIKYYQHKYILPQAQTDKEPTEEKL